MEVCLQKFALYHYRTGVAVLIITLEHWPSIPQRTNELKRRFAVESCSQIKVERHQRGRAGLETQISFSAHYHASFIVQSIGKHIGYLNTPSLTLGEARLFIRQKNFTGFLGFVIFQQEWNVILVYMPKLGLSKESGELRNRSEPNQTVYFGLDLWIVGPDADSKIKKS